MSDNSNTQAAPLAPAPPAAPTAEELQAKIAELEKQSEGRLRDLQSERSKRQELESRFSAPAPAPSPAQPDVTQDELGKVLNPYFAPVMERVKKAEAFVANTYRDKALDHLSTKLGKSKDAVVNDKELDDKLTGIVKRYNLVGNVYDVTVRAVDIMELENLRTLEAERKRAASASGNSSLPGSINPPVVVSSKSFSEEDFNQMPLVEYEKLSNEGSFSQDKDGKIVYTPKAK